MTESRARSVRRIVDTYVQRGMHDSHRVRLLLEPGNWTEYDPFLLLAEDWFTPGTFGDHPHRGFETVTLVLEGEIEHTDNHGGHGVLRPGDAQWMTAGRGVVHSEEAGADGAHSLQLWINLPKTHKMTEPRYQDLRGGEVPVRRERGAELRVYSGTSGDVTAPTKNHVPVTMIDFRIEPGASIVQALPAADNAFMYILTGSGRIGARDVSAGQVAWLTDGDQVEISASESLHAILWSGPRIGEPVAARGPFVMNTFEEIVQANEDFRAGRF